MAVDFDAVWTGATSGLFELAANWSPANVPTAAEDIFVPAGTRTIDATGMADTQFGILHIAKGYTGDLGTSGTPLLGAYTDIRHNGSGKLWYLHAAGTTSRVIINAPGQTDAADINGTISVVVVALRGIVTINGAAAILPRLEIGYKGDRSGDARVVLASGANAITLVKQWGGTLTANSREIVTLDQQAGEAIIKAGQGITTAAEIGGRLEFQSNTTLPLLRILGGGTADFAKVRTNDVTVTLAYRYPGSTLLRDKNLVALTTEYDWRD